MALDQEKTISPVVGQAYRECRRRARHYENFPVASRLVPREQRDALAAIYVFARTADDFADEPGQGDQQVRLALLADWRSKLAAALAGRPEYPVFVALTDAIERFNLNPENFEKLLLAFESDARSDEHPDFQSILTYCECSANPVGRLVLELFGHREPELFLLSDSICTALQLTNFWQDIQTDFVRGRIYLPAQDLTRFQISREHLNTASHGQALDAETLDRWQSLMAFEVARTCELFESGRPLAELVAPRLRRQLRLTWLGGTEILSRIEAADYDVFHRRPRLSALDFLRLYFKAHEPLAALEPAAMAAAGR